MSWKDWLYIPRSDKIAIISLLIFIIILLLILSIMNMGKAPQQEIDLTEYEPQDYQQWKNQLIHQREIEKEDFFKDYINKESFYQPKMKLGESIEVNTADTTMLKTIPGIGSGFANRIVNYREALGGFTDITQLNEVWGLDTYLYSQITPYIILEAKHDSLYINTDSFEKLIKHPYLNYKQVSTIIDIRERKGDIKSIKRLLLLDEFSRRDIERLAQYLSFKE